ncbi:hypothetical protein D3C83_204590 [compost metagenome]
MRQAARVNLDRQVRDRQRGEDEVPVVVDVAGRRRDDRDDAAPAAGSELPDVEVGDAHVVDRFELVPHDLFVAR